MLQRAKRETGKDAGSARISEYGRDRGRCMATRCSRLELKANVETGH